MFAESMAGGNIAVAVAADDGYAMPLAVTVRSLLDHLAPGRRLSLYLLDGGISDESYRRLLASWDTDRLELHVVRPDAKRLSDLKVSQHVNHLTYYRILLPELLPSSLGKVVYLDADLLIRRDISELWDQPLDDSWALAAQDCAAPFFDAAVAAANFPKCRPYVAALRPVPNFRDLGLSPNSPYLNGGVLAIDLDAWRRHDLANRMLACLRDNAEFVLWWDQYALNVALEGHWRPMDPRWNQGAYLFEYPDWQRSPFDERVFHQLKDDPWIVHFSSPLKPWSSGSSHPYRMQFFECLDRTDWRGLRPATWPHRRQLALRRLYRGLRAIKLRTPMARLGMP